jgi:hemerythrin-like domain-containing protein
MNAIHLLKQQHDDVKELFKKFEKADDEIEKDSICQQLANNLAAHMTIEERIFYPCVFSAMNDEAQLAKSMQEHEEAKRLLAQILDNDMSRDEDNFEDNMEQLKLMIAQHVAEEEEGVFKETKKVLANDELKRLGEQMKELFDQEMAGEPAEILSARGDTDETLEVELIEENELTEETDEDNAPL